MSLRFPYLRRLVAVRRVSLYVLDGTVPSNRNGKTEKATWDGAGITVIIELLGDFVSTRRLALASSGRSDISPSGRFHGANEWQYHRLKPCRPKILNGFPLNQTARRLRKDRIVGSATAQSMAASRDILGERVSLPRTAIFWGSTTPEKAAYYR